MFNATSDDVRITDNGLLYRSPWVRVGSVSARWPDGGWRSSWGWAVRCEGCGVEQVHTVSSSVACEDGPGHFAFYHRACNTLSDEQISLYQDMRHKSVERFNCHRPRHDVENEARLEDAYRDALRAVLASGLEL